MSLARSIPRAFGFLSCHQESLPPIVPKHVARGKFHRRLPGFLPLGRHFRGPSCRLLPAQFGLFPPPGRYILIRRRFRRVIRRHSHRCPKWQRLFETPRPSFVNGGWVQPGAEKGYNQYEVYLMAPARLLPVSVSRYEINLIDDHLRIWFSSYLKYNHYYTTNWRKCQVSI
jgi:hypothetical protein